MALSHVGYTPGSGSFISVAVLGGDLLPVSALYVGTDVVGASNPLPISAAALPLPAGAATDSGLAAIFLRQADGTQQTSVTGTVVVNASGFTVPISALSLPLPSGAATAARQDTGNTSLASIDGKLTNPLPVSALTLPLPTGAATAARQDTGNTSLASIDGKMVTCNTGAVTVTTCALPAGVATAANQTSGAQLTQLVDADGQVVEVRSRNGRNALVITDAENRRVLEEILLVLLNIQERLDAQ